MGWLIPAWKTCSSCKKVSRYTERPTYSVDPGARNGDGFDNVMYYSVRKWFCEACETKRKEVPQQSPVSQAMQESVKKPERGKKSAPSASG